MIRRLGVALLLVCVASVVWAQTADIEALDAQSEHFIRSRKIGALLLWGAMGVASIIITVVRVRQRLQRKRETRT